MKTLLSIVLALFISSTLFAQNSKNSKTPAPGPKDQSVYVKPIDRNSLVKKDSLYYYKKGDSLFSGKCAEFWPNNFVKVMYNYKSGKLNGSVTYFDEKGNVGRRESYKEGKPFGVWTATIR